MTDKLDESIIFLDNLLIGKEDYIVEIDKDWKVPLKQSCIDIAKKLKEYDRPINEQLVGLFCLCYRSKLIRPEKIDVSTINELIGEDMVDDIEIFSLFNLNESGVRSAAAAQNIEDNDKNYMWWLFLSMNDVIFQNLNVNGFLHYVLKFPNAPQSLRDTDHSKQQLTQVTLEQEDAYNRGIVQSFEDIAEGFKNL